MGFPTLVSNYLLFVGNMEMKESNFQDKSVRQKITTKENKKIIKVNTKIYYLLVILFLLSSFYKL